MSFKEPVFSLLADPAAFNATYFKTTPVGLAVGRLRCYPTLHTKDVRG